ncbi:S18L2 protein, partial [Ibidorhyncha struthersii]|nr:S18L2 protein [Ibidorhyncha struthersii]
MSVAFVPERLRGKAEVNQETLQRVSRGREGPRREEGGGGGTGSSAGSAEHILHRNLIYLATIADATPPSTQKTTD